MVLNDFYIDDLLGGADTKDELRNAYDQVTALLRSGGFTLNKWTTNEPILAQDINQHQNIEVPFPQESGVLGMKWLPQSDHFAFNIVAAIANVPEASLTKRKVLSITSQIYDPSGLIAPVIVTGKMLQQAIWRSGIEWDQQIPIELLEQWRAYKENISAVSSIRIPRWTQLSPQRKIQLHIFTDASEAAMGAVVYQRVIDNNGEVSVSLVISKSKVAPVKKVTIPRLELTAAHIGAQLYQYVKSAYRMQNVSAYFWSDSTIVIHWIRRDPAASKPFVANRVVDIRQMSDGASWRHVDGLQNPADLITRGTSAFCLKESSLWWQGPFWLARSEDVWPQPKATTFSPAILDAIQAESSARCKLGDDEAMVEKRAKGGKIVASVISLAQKHLVITNDKNETESLINRCSELSSLLRITAYVFRFVRNIQRAVKVRRELVLIGQTSDTHSAVSSMSYFTSISADERRKALQYWIRGTQGMYYSKELKACNANLQVQSTSSVKKLVPFVDDEKVLRVGGRLINSSCPGETKHQAIVPSESRLAYLIIRDTHTITLHGQAQLMMAHIRRSFWIPKLRQVINRYIHKCPTCIRHSKRPNDQLMGNLPAVRVNEAEPFAYTGVDFAGPFEIRRGRGRPKSGRGKVLSDTEKAWIVIFVCLVTRAAHLEVCIGLTIEEFMAAFERFIMRKGRCLDISCDNGSTFVGTDRELARVLNQWERTMPQAFLAKFNTRWRFITPAAPHKGGIWEAAVKAMKRHMKRAVGQQVLTKDELTQLTIQIEGCLNSRPLWPLSDDPADIAPMTPAHFVLGKPILPQPLAEDVAEVPPNRLTVWGQKQRLHQIIWKRWRDEYLVGLQQRHKWYNVKVNLKVDDMVVIRDENAPPAHWLLGKIKRIIPSADGLVRAAVVKTESGELERPVTKLCYLPPQQSPVDHPINGGEDV